MFTRIAFILGLQVMFSTAYAQSKTYSADFSKIEQWTVHGRQAEVVKEGARQVLRFNADKGQGLYLLKDYSFREGSLEFEVKGKNVDGRSFVGIAFHVQNDSTYDAVYLRPFNFMNTDTIRRWRAVQYIAHPGHPWHKLRESFPGKYENKVKPVPNPDDWFNVKITVEGKKVQVFVNHAEQPCLVVEKLSSYQKGGIALWVGEGSDGNFANLKVTPSKKS